MPARELNFDGLIGPTHNYAGLSYGNVASAKHQNLVSYPRAAALQGLAKMKLLAEMGIGQCVLPPSRRPRIDFLRDLGFAGTNDAQTIESAYRASPVLLAACYSAASMWTANAATVSPAIDCEDDRLHLSVANLGSTLHRSLEPDSTSAVLQQIFSEPRQFAVHPPLPCSSTILDEGAANHLRLAPQHGEPGIEIFVFGSDPLNPEQDAPRKFPARQTRQASQSVARRHQLPARTTLFWQQYPAAIDAGVFHNDVISVSNENVFLCHDLAFVDQPQKLAELKKLFRSIGDRDLYVIEFRVQDISLEDTVRSYLFNSQLVTQPDGKMTLICPIECEEIRSARDCVQRIVDGPNPVDEVKFLNLRQSMNNGGGPACLRLKVVLSESQQASLHPGIALDAVLAERLESWINLHYRESLAPDDLRDPSLIDEVQIAMDQLEEILGLQV